MIHYVNDAAMTNRPLVERAVSAMLSMAETAKATITGKGGARFERGAMTLLANPGGVVQWRDTTPRRSASVDFQGVYVERDGVDPRLSTLRAVQLLARTMETAYRDGVGIREMTDAKGLMRRPYAALRAAAGLAGLHHADLHLRHAWEILEPEAMIYCDGPGPYHLQHGIKEMLFRDVPQACCVMSHATGDVIRMEVAAASFEEEIADDAMGLMRWMSECGLTESELRLERQS